MASRAGLILLLLALAPTSAQGAEGVRTLTAVRIEGGDLDDRRFAAAALGLKSGMPVDAAALRQALEAVRLVDRYRSVEGRLQVDGSALLVLEPLLPVASWSWEGDSVPKQLQKGLLPELRRGQRVGPQRRAVLSGLIEQRLREAGYPQAWVVLAEADQGRQLRLRVSLGAPLLVRAVRLEGDPTPYTREGLLKAAGLVEGVSIWTPTMLREAQRRLRQRFVKDDRLEGSVRLSPAEGAQDVLVMEVHPGPLVKLEASGLSFFSALLGQPSLSEFVPLARAERYSPSLLDEGAGRITTSFRDQGYPEVKVSYTRKVTTGSPDRPEAVALVYTVEPGPQRTLGQVHFEGNKEVSELDLQAAVVLPRRNLIQAPFAKTEAVKVLEERVTALYLQRGFPEVRVRRRVDQAKDGSVELRFLIREGRRRFLDALILELPGGPGFPREGLAQGLLQVFADRPVAVPGTPRYQSDRRHLQGFEGTLEASEQGVRLTFKPPLPLVRNDLALVVADLRQRLSSAGAETPQVKLALEDGDLESVVRIQIPPQPLDAMHRLVVHRIQGLGRLSLIHI